MVKITSERFAETINVLRELEREYQICAAKLLKVERAEIDLLHFLEIYATNYKERNKIATQLRICLLERRVQKDHVDVLKPFAEFLAKPENKGILDRLAQVLGDIRKQERHLQDRIYKPRILTWPTTEHKQTQKPANKRIKSRS